ncbi:DUF4097 family beta strand repeat-containing protein [Prauserella flavalba]|uniref:DUF4097 domain-containing protein n=1 Tax=Prauserella flavalba TaxID=1477506 RepID=A0A318LY55_9PSEU|nr:DUF4097 family beta strand repeat-containing protein [Prauserella flavalba]PXY38395.1 hypothetical protein BA062_01155 [Prauserella flavalba]
MGRAGLAIGGVALIGVGIAFGLGWFWPATSEATATVDQRVSRVELANDSGDVLVRAEEGAETTTVRQRFSYRWGEPEEAYEVRDGTLVLAGCGSWCSVDYEVIVPEGTTVSGSVDSGDVTLEDVSDVRVQADSGDFTGTRLRGAVDVSVDSGDLTLTLDEPRDVKLAADSGDVEVTVPDGAYRVIGTTDSGDREIGVTQDPDASAVLDLSTDSGDVTVHAA